MRRGISCRVPTELMAAKPPGVPDLEGVVANAKPHATITIPAAWIRDLLAYVRVLEATIPAE